MFSRRHVSSYLVLMLLASLGIAFEGAICLGAPTNGPPSSKDEDKDLMAVYGRYQRESHELKPANRQSFSGFWEGEFKKALAASKGSSFLRLRIMDELGAIQGSLGKKAEASQTYRDMAVLAKQTKDVRSQALAAENQLGLAANEPMETVKRIATEFEESARQLANQHDSAEARAKLSDSLVRIGTALMARANAGGKDGKPTELVEQAKRALEQSIAMGDSGTTPVPTRLYWLARSQSGLGQKKEAGATYKKIAAMDQSVLSRLWMEYLGICETTTKDSLEYRTAIERALADFQKRGGADDYEVTMRHQLGLSYRSAGQYAKSTEVLSAIIGKSNDSNLNAYNMLLVAMNAASSGDAATSRDLCDDVTKQYPKTGSAQIATHLLEAGLKEPESEIPSTGRFQMWLTAISVVVLVVLVAASVMRPRRKKSP